MTSLRERWVPRARDESSQMRNVVLSQPNHCQSREASSHHQRRSSAALDPTNQPLWINTQPSRDHEEVSGGDCLASVLKAL